MKGFEAVALHGCTSGLIPVPVIGDNGNWFIGNDDTGVKAGTTSNLDQRLADLEAKYELLNSDIVGYPDYSKGIYKNHDLGSSESMFTEVMDYDCIINTTVGIQNAPNYCYISVNGNLVGSETRNTPVGTVATCLQVCCRRGDTVAFRGKNVAIFYMIIPIK